MLLFLQIISRLQNIISPFYSCILILWKMVDKKRVMPNTEHQEVICFSKLFGGGFVANGEYSGKIVGFNLSAPELAKKIEEYKQLVKDGSIELPFWTDFREYLGIRQDVLDEVMERGYFSEGARDNAYHERAVMLKRMGETCENYLNTHPNWGGRNAVKSMMLLKQGLGYTKKYVDEKGGAKAGPAKTVINFGGGDERAKKAGK